MKTEFKKGDEVIWDSGWGYELGVFIGKSESQFYGYEVDMRTGIVIDKNTLPEHEVHLYSDSLVDHLTKKYGYEKRFSRQF